MSPKNPETRRSYFDYNATSPLASGVADAVGRALMLPGNPSSQHREGRQAQAMLDESRETVARALGADALDIVFTSGGTEANHLGLLGLTRTKADTASVHVAPTVHPSLWAACQRAGAEAGGCRPLPVASTGALDLDALEDFLGEAKGGVLGLSFANHELGVLENVERVSALCRASETLLFCDAVQALGRVPVDQLVNLVDGLSLSAHKIGGPKGVGALWLKPGYAVEALIGGGKQEAGRRPGTQAVALIAGFAAACEGIAGRLADAPRQRELRDRLGVGLEKLGAVLNSRPEGLCNTVHARFPGIPGELIVSGLDLRGYAVSTGAACSSGTAEPSAVLLGMGLTKREALEGLRLSIGPETQASEVQSLLEVLPAILERAKRF